MYEGFLASHTAEILFWQQQNGKSSGRSFDHVVEAKKDPRPTTCNPLEVHRGHTNKGMNKAYVISQPAPCVVPLYPSSPILSQKGYTRDTQSGHEKRAPGTSHSYRTNPPLAEGLRACLPGVCCEMYLMSSRWYALRTCARDACLTQSRSGHTRAENRRVKKKQLDFQGEHQPRPTSRLHRNFLPC